MDTRWTDRVYSSTGEWSGNICDFYFKVINKLGQTLKVPFKLVGDTRIDDTPVHKAVREAVVNCLVNADYYGRCGLVIKRKLNELTLENPGGFRVPLDLAISGGLSDPRNSVLMKMFNLLNIGERAGAGIPNIFHVWDKEKLGVPKYEEIMNGSRAKLTLPLEYASSKQAETSSKRAVTLDNKSLILSYLEENKRIYASEAANLLKLSESRTRAILKEMTAAQVLEKIGSYRGAYYVMK
jgi:predicted HTH transcriptional regulator